MKIITIAFLSLTLISCAEGQAFIEVDEISVDHKLYIVPIRPMIREVGSGENLLIPKPILIDNSETIKEIIDEWGTEKSQHPGFPIYKVILTENEKVIRTLSLNENLSGMFTGHGYFAFNPDLLFKHKMVFEYLEWINIKVNNLEDGKTLLHTLNENSFVYPEFIHPHGDFQQYSGSMTIKRKMADKAKDYQPIVINDFKTDLISLKRRQDIGRDSVLLTVWTAKNISSGLPPEYALIEDWKEFENIEIELTGIDIARVKSIAENLKIDATIK